MRLRTGYSFRHAVGKMEDCIAAWDVEGFGEHVPITDRNSTFGWIRWQELCKKNDLKAVFGVELGVSPDIHAKRPVVDWWLFFPKDGNLQALNDLVGLSTEQFRYQPLLTYEQATNPDVFSVAGRLTNFKSLKECGGLPDAWQYSPASGKKYLATVQELNGHFFACGENVHANKGDRALYEVVCGRNAKANTWPQHILKADAFDLPAAVQRSKQALEQLYCGDLPQSELPKIKASKRLPRLCVEGARTRNIDLRDPIYRARLKRELDMIYEKGYEDYFHIVSEIVMYAKERMLVGPARGSSAGSLVCYLLGITSVDPIPFGLIFERFIDINRHDMPDIDIDFSDQQRGKVINYIRKRYGKENVSQLGAVATYQIQSSLKEVGKSYKIPIADIERLSASIIKRSSGDARANLSVEDCLNDNEIGRELVERYPQLKLAAKMEGHPRHCSTHASAIILSNSPINHIVAMDRREGRLMLDKKDAEKVNLLKIDALGLTQLSILENVVRRVSETGDEYTGRSINDIFETLPQKESAYEALRNKKYAGIFQFEGVALQSVAKQISINEFKDLEVLSAICRPGPLVSGNTTKWVRRRMEHEKITYPHKVFEPFIEDTLGVIIYQEQVMQIGREIGELGWDKVTELRKAMSKSLGKEYFDKFGAPWKAAAVAKGIPEKTVDKVWDDMCAYGSWAFNKSHSVSYGIISYWCCYMKSFHLLEYAAATLDAEGGNAEKQLKMLRELDKEGIKYVPFDKQVSSDRWEIREGKLYGPYQNIKGIGPKSVKALMDGRKRGDKIPPAVQKKIENAITSIDELYPITAYWNSLDHEALRIISEPTHIIDIDESMSNWERMIVASIKKINVRDLNEAVFIAKRGYEITQGQTKKLHLQVEDDSGILFCLIRPQHFEELGRNVIKLGEGQVYALKGEIFVTETFKMMKVTQTRHLGELP